MIPIELTDSRKLNCSWIVSGAFTVDWVGHDEAGESQGAQPAWYIWPDKTGHTHAHTHCGDWHRYQLAKLFCGEWECCTETEIVRLSDCIKGVCVCVSFSNEVLFQFPFDRPQASRVQDAGVDNFMHKFIPCVSLSVCVYLCAPSVCVWVCVRVCASWLTEIRVRYFLPPHLFVLTVPRPPLTWLVSSPASHPTPACTLPPPFGLLRWSLITYPLRSCLGGWWWWLCI